MEQDIKILMHGEEVGDRLAGLISAYLLWSGMVPESHKAIVVIEQILGRQLGPEGRHLVTAAQHLVALRESGRAAPGVAAAESDAEDSNA